MRQLSRLVVALAGLGAVLAGAGCKGDRGAPQFQGTTVRQPEPQLPSQNAFPQMARPDLVTSPVPPDRSVELKEPLMPQKPGEVWSPKGPQAPGTGGAAQAGQGLESGPNADEVTQGQGTGGRGFPYPESLRPGQP